jgi:NAD(P)-dependent dehydrogenase (short-subunit alcohol dehydrogenase family)
MSSMPARHAIVVGASGGIGTAVVERFLQRDLGVVGIDTEPPSVPPSSSDVARRATGTEGRRGRGRL